MQRALTFSSYSFRTAFSPIVRKGEAQVGKSFHSSAFVQGGAINVILIDAVEGTGHTGEIVKVKRGFARNFLIPRNKAAYATDENRKKYEDLLSKAKRASIRGENAKLEMARVTNEQSLALLKQQIEDVVRSSGVVVTITAKATADGRLYGAVTNADVAQTLRTLGVVSVVPGNITMAPIKSIGTHAVAVAGVELQLSVVADIPAAVAAVAESK
jgi:large subunit ribosomal protein L9